MIALRRGLSGFGLALLRLRRKRKTTPTMKRKEAPARIEMKICFWSSSAVATRSWTSEAVTWEVPLSLVPLMAKVGKRLFVTTSTIALPDADWQRTVVPSSPQIPGRGLAGDGWEKCGTEGILPKYPIRTSTGVETFLEGSRETM